MVRVTGGSRGIGRATTRALHRDGFHVVLHHRSSGARADELMPLGEITPPEDVAEVIAFLASGRSRYTTGATIDVTGADDVR